MPQLQDRNQSRSEELFEAALTGPFGGIQSELPPTEIEQLGFLDARNVLFRKGVGYSRLGFTALPAFPAPTNEPILAVPGFFNANGTYIQCVLTTTRLLQFTSGTWTPITGPAFTGTATQLFSWDVLNYKLCFSQGSDKLFVWDGISGSYTQIATAQTFSYIAEIGLHLFGINPATPQRYYWSAIGDPTDWTSPSSGLNDNVSNLGPINGILKIGQYGFGLHQNGFLAIVPTGIGTAPFAFYPLVNRPPSLKAPYTLAALAYDGEEYAVYLSDDNVYLFNGTSIEPIGDRPIDKGRRLGARSRILADFAATTQGMAYGFVTTSISGQPYNSYWLIFPNVSVWVYNFDEGNWAVFTYSGTLVSAGLFRQTKSIEIKDLVGRIIDQSWTPATLAGSSNSISPGVLLGFNNGVAGYSDFSTTSEQPCSITSGKLIFGDRRHKHTIKKFRLTFLDQAPVTYTIKLANEKGKSQTFSFTVGTGSGDVLNYVQEFSITGLRLQYVVSWPAGQPGAIVELAPMYDISGEQRGGLIDN